MKIFSNSLRIPEKLIFTFVLQGKGLTATMGQLDGSSAVSSSSVSAGSPLVGQMLRAGQAVVSSSPVLPSYSQAISQTTATVVRAIRPAGQQPNPAQISTAAAARRSVDGVTLNGSATAQRFSLTVPALSALLAGLYTL